MLQLSIVYTEAHAEGLGLGPQEVVMELVKDFTVLPGPHDKLTLAGQSLEAERTVLNMGSPAQRSIVLATTLRLEDR